MTKYSFPDKITEHIVTLNNSVKIRLFVSPSETFGKALERTKISSNDVLCVSLFDSPIWYEPDYSVASR